MERSAEHKEARQSELSVEVRFVRVFVEAVDSGVVAALVEVPPLDCSSCLDYTPVGFLYLKYNISFWTDKELVWM